MTSEVTLYVVIPILAIFKLLFWVCICYRRSERYRSSRMRGQILIAQPTRIIHRTVHVAVDNEINGIENTGYMQPPPDYTTVMSENRTQAQPSAPPSYDQVVNEQRKTTQHFY